MDDCQGDKMLVRPYESEDRQAMLHIFRETAHADLRNADDTALRYASLIWCLPYLMLEPEHCFAVDNGHGTTVGYVIGTPNTERFVRRWQQEYLRYLASQELSKPGPEESVEWNEHLPNALRLIMHCPEHLLHEQEPDLMKDYPAHLHIDILPEFQRRGMGRQMIDRFCAKAGAAGACGVHLVRAGDNIGSGLFYERVGFQRYPHVLDGGSSGEMGRDKNNNVWQVKRL